MRHSFTPLRSSNLEANKRRYYVNGRRVCRDVFDNIVLMAQMYGRRDNFITTLTTAGSIQVRSCASLGVFVDCINSQRKKHYSRHKKNNNHHFKPSYVAM